MKTSTIGRPASPTSSSRVFGTHEGRRGPGPYVKTGATGPRNHPVSSEAANTANTASTAQNPANSFVRTDGVRPSFYEVRHALMNETRRLFGHPQLEPKHVREQLQAYAIGLRQTYPYARIVRERTGAGGRAVAAT